MATTGCPTCGAFNAPPAGFCSTCGTALRSRLTVDERRTVTALFADLVGSTALSEHLDPEVMRSLVGQFFELCVHEIGARGGTVERFSGDAVLGLFGLVASHEDDAERAVRAAVAVREGMAAMAKDARTRHGVNLAGRWGIESGEVVIGDPFGGGTVATGDAINLAARLEQTAAAGEIVVGPTAHAATRNAVVYAEEGEMALRGKAQPVRAWRVVEVAAALGGTRGIPGLSAPLTGRDEELALLVDAAHRAVQEQKPVLFTILGAPGVGKSRLVRELGVRLATEGWEELRGRCLPYGEGITYWPLAEIVRSAAELPPDLTPEAALLQLREACRDEGMADRLAFAIGLVSDPPVAGEGIDREIAFAFRGFLEGRAGTRPVILVIEDIHWAEPILLDLLEYLATWIRGAPVLIVCPARPELIDRRPGWGGGRMEAHRIQLEPLSRDESAALVNSLLAIDQLPDALRGRILERAEGNPLFVEETIRMLIDQGVIERRGGRWAATVGDLDVAVPATVEALIRARLDTLPRDERALLQAASVIGRTFQRTALAAVASDPMAVEAGLDEALLRDLITEETGPLLEPTYRFKHILIRDVAYASLAKSRRAELHLRVEAWLRAWAGERRDEFIEIGAYHLDEAVRLQLELHGEADATTAAAAVDALERSAQLAIERGDFRAAETFAERALAVGIAGPERRLEIEGLLLDALVSRSDRRMTDLGKRMESEARAIGRSDLEGWAIFGQAFDTWVRVGTAQGAGAALPLLERAFELLRDGSPARLAKVVEMLGYQGWWYGDLGAAWQWWSEGRTIGRDAGDRGIEALACRHLAAIRSFQGRIEESRALYEDARRLARESGNRLVSAQIDRAYASGMALWGEFVAARELALSLIPVLEEASADEELEACLDTIGVALMIEGRPAEAVATHERQLDIVQRMGHLGRIPEAEQHLAQALVQLGDLEAAERHALRGRETALQDDVSTVASTILALGTVRAAQGRDAEAEALLAEAASLIKRTDYRAVFWEYHLALAEFHLSRGHEPAGSEWLELIRADLREAPRPGVGAYVETRIARLRRPG